MKILYSHRTSEHLSFITITFIIYWISSHFQLVDFSCAPYAHQQLFVFYDSVYKHLAHLASHPPASHVTLSISDIEPRLTIPARFFPEEEEVSFYNEQDVELVALNSTFNGTLLIGEVRLVNEVLDDILISMDKISNVMSQSTPLPTFSPVASSHQHIDASNLCLFPQHRTSLLNFLSTTPGIEDEYREAMEGGNEGLLRELMLELTTCSAAVVGIGCLIFC